MQTKNKTLSALKIIVRTGVTLAIAIAMLSNVTIPVSAAKNASTDETSLNFDDYLGSWFTDAGGDPNADYIHSPADDFVITVKTDNPGVSSNTQFVIPTYPGETYNYNVDCNNDGVNEATANTGNYTCNYPAAGTYTVRIQDNTGLGTGFPRIYFHNTGDAPKLLTIEQWGTGKWTSMAIAFYGCYNLAGQASDSPDLSGVTSMSLMFANAIRFNQNIGNWNTSNVTNMDGMFWGAQAFNQPIGNWNTANVTDMSWMFYKAENFNQYIGDWNTANVTDMYAMFSYSHFNQNIGGWNTSNVTSMGFMFNSAYDFNRDIGNWDTTNVTDMSWMFNYAYAFNQNIGNWNTANVNDMHGMFMGTQAFNQPIGNWNTAKVIDMGYMFSYASAFDQNIGNWNTTNVTDMSGMFDGVTLSIPNYDSLLNGWNKQNLQHGVSFSGGNSRYCISESARSNIITTYGWTITDGGKNCNGPIFADVAADHWARNFIERLYFAGVTGGCFTSPLTYCPTATVTRDQMAVFLLRGEHGSAYTPPTATGTMFADVPATHWAAAWIEQLANEGITGGCGNGNYCPSIPVTRDQMAVFLLRGEHGGSYVPPEATGATFADVPSTHWAAAWIEQLANEGITGGCGNGNYCPSTPVTRDQMAVFLVRAFGLP